MCTAVDQAGNAARRGEAEAVIERAAREVANSRKDDGPVDVAGVGGVDCPRIDRVRTDEAIGSAATNNRAAASPGRERERVIPRAAGEVCHFDGGQRVGSVGTNG